MKIDKVELKFTALPEDEQRVLDFLAGHESKHRDVYFYETRPRTVSARGIVLRVRDEGVERKSTAKLRPAGRGVAIAARQDNPKVEIELDEVAREAVLSAKLDHEFEPGDPFSAEQRRLIDRFTPGIAWDALERLGPVDATVWEVKRPSGLDYKLAAEAWRVEDFHFVELSIKVDPDEADEARTAFRTFLAALVDDVDGDRSRKTERVLELLAPGVNAATLGP
jgi:hypothetical protein